MKGSAVTI